VDLLAGAREVAGVKVLAVKVPAVDPKGLRELADTLKDRLGSGVVVLGCASRGESLPASGGDPGSDRPDQGR